jgi:phenylpropionate dioxygenase-like ring-hydroxylating dioxygenase large terminal subunit
MADDAPKTDAKAPSTVFGRGLLGDVWWFAALGAELKPGKLQRYELFGDAVLLGRTRAGEVYAMRDICPHRAAPLSAGRLVGERGAEEVECPYHGWRFRTDGACAAIPCARARGWCGSGTPPTRAPRPSPITNHLRSKAWWAARPSWSSGWTSTATSTTRWWA